jgi:putative tryptophan/tyrosine transport system substrate-binding protein
MRRRDFLGLVGGAAAAWPLAARAQQSALPVVGYLGVGSPATSIAALAAFRKGLGEGGFVESQNVAIEYRWAESVDRLAELAADLVRRQVAVIATSPSTAAGVAAKAATATIPIVFNVGGDPIQLGLVTNLNRPGANVTGMSFLSADVVAKNLELLHEAVPNATIMAALVNPQNPIGEPNARQAQEAARILGLQLHVLCKKRARS